MTYIPHAAAPRHPRPEAESSPQRCLQWVASLEPWSVSARCLRTTSDSIPQIGRDSIPCYSCDSGGGSGGSGGGGGGSSSSSSSNLLKFAPASAEGDDVSTWVAWKWEMPKNCGPLIFIEHSFNLFGTTTFSLTLEGKIIDPKLLDSRYTIFGQTLYCRLL